jgi:hypothetical protein
MQDVHVICGQALTRSAIECFQNSVEITEGFALVEFLLEHDFVIISTGKVRRDKDPRDDEERIFTWFILSKANILQHRP